MEPKNISPRLANGGDAADACIAAARSFVEQYCGWHIAPVREDTVLLDGNGLKILSFLHCMFSVLPLLRLTEIFFLKTSTPGLRRGSFVSDMACGRVSFAV